LKRRWVFTIIVVTYWRSAEILSLRREPRITVLLGEGWRLFRRGRAREAADAFSRILLLDPSHREARDGLRQAQSAAAEQDRVGEAKLDEARRAAAAGDIAGARALVEQALLLGSERDAARDILDRLDARGGRLQSSLRHEAGPDEPRATPRAGGPSSTRRMVTVAWAVAFALLAGGLVASWESLVESLVRTPSPSTGLVVSSVDGAPPAGPSALAEARRLMEEGDRDGALAKLDRISPSDPAYPLARRLRAELESGTLDRGPER
jgi:hypothetical protein